MNKITVKTDEIENIETNKELHKESNSIENTEINEEINEEIKINSKKIFIIILISISLFIVIINLYKINKAESKVNTLLQETKALLENMKVINPLEDKYKEKLEAAKTQLETAIIELQKINTLEDKDLLEEANLINTQLNDVLKNINTQLEEVQIKIVNQYLFDCNEILTILKNNTILKKNNKNNEILKLTIENYNNNKNSKQELYSIQIINNNNQITIQKRTEQIQTLITQTKIIKDIITKLNIDNQFKIQLENIFMFFNNINYNKPVYKSKSKNLFILFHNNITPEIVSQLEIFISQYKYITI